MIFTCEVDIVLIGVSINPRPEIHMRNIPVIPPVPGYLARLDPTGIPYPRWRSQPVDHIVIRQLAVMVAADDDPPGIRAAPYRPRNIICPTRNQQLQLVMATSPLLQRIRRKPPLQAEITCTRRHKHPRIILKIRLEKRRFPATV